MHPLAVAFLPLVGVVLGAILQSRLSRAAARETQAGNLRAQSYADYLRAVAAAGHLRSDDDLRNALRDAADAKARIAIFGSSEVIVALSQFEQAGANLSGPAAPAFISLVASMRAGNAVVVPESDLRWVLLGPSQQGIAEGNLRKG